MWKLAQKLFQQNRLELLRQHRSVRLFHLAHDRPPGLPPRHVRRRPQGHRGEEGAGAVDLLRTRNRSRECLLKQVLGGLGAEAPAKEGQQPSCVLQEQAT